MAATITKIKRRWGEVKNWGGCLGGEVKAEWSIDGIAKAVWSTDVEAKGVWSTKTVWRADTAAKRISGTNGSVAEAKGAGSTKAVCSSTTNGAVENTSGTAVEISAAANALRKLTINGGRGIAKTVTGSERERTVVIGIDEH